MPSDADIRKLRGDQPKFFSLGVTRPTGTTYTTSTVTAVEWDAVRHAENTVAQTPLTNLTAPVTGVYVVTLQIVWNDTGTTGGRREALIMHSAGAVQIGGSKHPEYAGGNTTQTLSAVAAFRAGELTTANVWQNSGSGLGVVKTLCFMTLTFLGSSSLARTSSATNQ